MTTRASIKDLQARIGQSIIGQEQVIERMLMALLAGGNILMEGLPGLAKTRAIKSLAKNLESDFRRIQFTPDLLPSDVTGSEMYYEEGGKGTFRFQAGPIFGNLILADEINRAPAKVQAALLEAMEEHQVTVAGTTHAMPDLFMVMATQNPVEQEGTYPLPEAQMDRFLIHILIDYPDEAAEAEIISLVRGESKQASTSQDVEPIAQHTIFEARAEIDEVRVSQAVQEYMVNLVFATRYPDRYQAELSEWIAVGVSPRAGIALDKCARTLAWLNDRDHVLPQDVQEVVHDCFRHRITPSYEASAEGITNSAIIDRILELVATA